MAQRWNFRSLAATAVLPRSDPFPHPKKPRATPLRAGDGTGDARQAAMGLAVPQEAVIHYGDMVSGPLPFAHQNGPGPRQRRCRRRVGRTVGKGMGEQPVQLSGDWFCQPAVAPFLSRMGNGECEHIASKVCRWFVRKLLGPKGTQFSTGQWIEVELRLDLDRWRVSRPLCHG